MGEKETWDEAKRGPDKGVRDERFEDDPEGRHVKSSKSNSSERLADEGSVGPGQPSEATNLNTSRSNVARSAADPAGPAESAIKSSDSKGTNPRDKGDRGADIDAADQGLPERPARGA